jgi:hypothetical protein
VKITLNEFDSVFFMELEAEDVKDVSMLARFSAGAKREPAEITTYFSRSGDVGAQVSFKRKVVFTAEI